MESQVLNFVIENGGVTNKDVAERLGINVQKANGLLKKLRADGKVAVIGDRKGKGRGRPASVFGRPTEAVDNAVAISPSV